MAAKRLPPFLVFLMVLAVLGVGAAALRPVAVELQLTWKLRSPAEAEWKAAAEALIEKGSRSGLARAVETALVRDPKGFGTWQVKLFERRPRDVRWALPAYEAGLHHELASVRRAAVNALFQSGWRRPEAVPVVAGALESPSPVLRWQAGHVLHAMGPGAGAAAPALIRAARDPEENVRWAAVYALGAMAPVAPDAVPALARALGDPSVLVASHAAAALGGFGPRAAAAVPALIEAFRKGDVLVKVEAARALGALGRTARGALPVILEALKAEGIWTYEPFGSSWGDLNDKPSVGQRLLPGFGPLDGRVDLLEAVLRLGAGAGDMLPCLLKLIVDPSYPVRQAAAAALGRIGPAASAAVPDLVKSLTDKEPQRRWSPSDTSETNYAAADALGAMGPSAVPALVEALRSSDSRTRYGAARALGKMDGADAETIQALRSALSDARFTVIIAAARGLKRFEPDADVVPALLDAAAGGSSRDEITWHLESLDGLAGKEAIPSLPLLREALSKEGAVPACVAVRLLASMAREAVEPLQDLFATLETRDKSLRHHSVEAAGGLASRAEEIVPRLIRVLEGDPDRNVRVAAAWSLGRLGTKSEAALPTLWTRYLGEEKKEDKRTWLKAISAVSPGDPRVLEVRLREAEGDSGVSWALDSILKAGSAARPLLPAVEGFLEREDLGVRVKAARALWTLDRRAEPALAIAREALGDHWRSGRWTPILSTALRTPAEWRNPVREEAARLLSGMGAVGKSAVPGLTACLDFPGHTVRILATEALWKTAGDLRLDVLVEAVEDSFPDLSRDPTRIESFTDEALRVIGEMGPAARGAIPSLERLRAAATAGPLREAAEETLRKVGGERT